MFGIDMQFTVGGYNAVHPVIGDHIGIDDETEEKEDNHG